MQKQRLMKFRKAAPPFRFQFRIIVREKNAQFVHQSLNYLLRQ